MSYLSILKFWREGLIALLLLSTIHLNSVAVKWHHRYEASEQSRKDDAVVAKKKNEDEVKTTENRWAATVVQQDKNYEEKLADANRSLQLYADRLRNQGRVQTGTGSVSATPGTSEGSTGTSEETVLPVAFSDLAICTENTVKAEQWQEFYNKLRTDQH